MLRSSTLCVLAHTACSRTRSAPWAEGADNTCLNLLAALPARQSGKGAHACVGGRRHHAHALLQLSSPEAMRAQRVCAVRYTACVACHCRTQCQRSSARTIRRTCAQESAGPPTAPSLPFLSSISSTWKKWVSVSCHTLHAARQHLGTPACRRVLGRPERHRASEAAWDSIRRQMRQRASGT
jgi:hypothetical protein